MGDDHDDPSTLGESVMETENIESVSLSVSIVSDDSKNDELIKKKRKSRKKSDGYKSRKRSRSTKPTTSDEYEVEMIIDHKTDEKGREFYLVHWKGWSDDDDSWVPIEDCDCPALIAEFYQRNPDKDPNGLETRQKKAAESAQLQSYIEGILKPANEDIDLAMQLVCSSSDRHKLNGFKIHLSNEEINKYAFMVYRKKQKLLQMEKNLMMQLLTRDFRQRRVDQLQRLKEWENQINETTQGKPPVKIENNVDLDEPPVGFTYVTQCKAGDGVVIPDDPVIGCECLDCIDGRKTCCGPMSGTQSAYTKAGRLKVPVGTPIYECNSRCRCGPECPNRVVQRGSKLKLCIFRTNNGCGWGVKTLETIRKNSFVIEYVGEVITNEEAEKRGVQYDSEGRTYLFDLDFNDIDCVYSVDAAHQGNVAHFINHSCDPNLAVFAVWANCMDPNMPRLALFAQRDIHVGEELTFDYASSKTENPEGKTTASSDKEVSVKNECRCGATNCRKIMFSLPENQIIAPFLKAE